MMFSCCRFARLLASRSNRVTTFSSAAALVFSALIATVRPERVLDGAVNDRHAAGGDLFDDPAVADALEHGRPEAV